MGVPFIQARDPLTPLLQQAFSGTGQAIGQGIFRGRKSSALEQILKDATDEQGVVNEEQVVKQLSGSNLFGLDDAAKFQRQGLERKQQNLREDEFDLKKEEFELKKQAVKDVNISQSNSGKLFDQLDKGNISALQLVKEAQNIPDKAIRDKTISVGQSILANEARVESKTKAEREKFKLGDLSKVLDRSTVKAEIAQRNINAIETVSPLFDQVTTKDKLLKSLESSGFVDPSVRTLLQSSTAAQVDQAAKAIVANEAKLIGGSNPNQMQTQLLVDATLNVGKNTESNKVLAAYSTFSNKFDIAMKNVDQEVFDRALDGDPMSSKEIAAEKDNVRQRLIDDFNLASAEIKGITKIPPSQRLEVARILKSREIIDELGNQ